MRPSACLVTESSADECLHSRFSDGFSYVDIRIVVESQRCLVPDYRLDAESGGPILVQADARRHRLGDRSAAAPARGPILFRQSRMGLGGRTFTCFKFRTMVPDAEARLKELEACNESAGGVLFKIKSDPRITPLGRFLRRSSLDELPQLWNVLRGDMSLVGPRPLQMRDSERLAQLEPAAYLHRLSVLPGITGPWQVGGRSEVDSDRMLRLDLDYVNDWSIAADFRILSKTVGVVLAGKGAS